MDVDLWYLYEKMLRSRLFEQLIAEFWQKGMISGELHQGTGEEAIVVSIIEQLQLADSVATDHRGTSAFLTRGVSALAILKELLGYEDGLCRGQGGHMHLFDKDHSIAASGIVGAAAPLACGFALSAKTLNKNAIAVAFFGEGALNQGMLLEAFNLAQAWCLPVLFVCKDNGMAITTESATVTAGSPVERAQGFQLPTYTMTGFDIENCYQTSAEAISTIRLSGKPAFIHATCSHFDGHFLGDPLLRIIEHPVKELSQMASSMIGSTLNPHGAKFGARIDSLKNITVLLNKTLKNKKQKQQHDPLAHAREKLEQHSTQLAAVEQRVADEISAIVEAIPAAPMVDRSHD